MNFSSLLTITCMLAGTSSIWAETNNSASTYAERAELAFRNGDYKAAAKNWESAVKLDATNSAYREGLGRTYERKAEQSSFPMALTAKARRSLVRALELQPDNAAALEDLIDLAQQPIGLCEGNLTEASELITRLRQVDPASADRKQESWLDARREASRPGQRALCGPVKLSRTFLPNGTSKPPIPAKTEPVLVAKKD